MSISTKKSNIDPTLIDAGEFSKLEKIYWVIIIICALIYIPVMFKGNVGAGFVGFIVFFLIIYFGWFNRLSKKRLGYAWNDVWKIRKEIKGQSNNKSDNKPSF